MGLQSVVNRPLTVASVDQFPYRREASMTPTRKTRREALGAVCDEIEALYESRGSENFTGAQQKRYISLLDTEHDLRDESVKATGSHAVGRTRGSGSLVVLARKPVPGDEAEKGDEFQAFENLTRRLVGVPKREIDAERTKANSAKAK
jgi:hypothetical protein